MPLDEDKLKAFSLNVWKYKQGEMVSLMIHLGDRLGLYKAMDGEGLMTSSELAEKTGLHERWVREWLHGQAAGSLLEYEEGRFELTPEGAEILAHEEDSLMFAAGAFHAPAGVELAERLAEAFRTGIGLTYEQLGPNAAHRTERMLGPWTRLALVPEIIPALDGVHDKLQQGAVAADVGCGGGLAIAAMAEAYPNSQFHGYDPSSSAIERLNNKISNNGLKNLSAHVASGEELTTEPTFDFLITFDCLHDMTHPDRVIGTIKKALKPDGTWLIKDIRSHPDFEKNRRHPLLAMMYGFSVSACMSSAMSEPDGMGLGTLGFNPEVAERMLKEGGFSHFQVKDFDDPSNLYYEVRH
ncbi:MAG: class I SAM-dependent methyltransferase [Pseudomonadota bacterium]